MRCKSDELPAYPLRFDPILQYRIWGGQRLREWISGPFPADDLVGEAWLLSDRIDNPSRVADGPLAGQSLPELMAHSPVMLLGGAASRFSRFPLLLKYLDVAKMLSVQVHPSDQDQDLVPPGETGKTEAWLILEADPASQVYAGLKPGATKAALRALSMDSVDGLLAGFTPQAGQCILVEAGTVHALGDGIVVLEVQQNSDVTFRLYDWDHIDAKTSLPRPLQIDQALQAIAMDRQAVRPALVQTRSTGLVRRELMLESPYFRLERVTTAEPFEIGTRAGPAILICLEGYGHVEHPGTDVRMEKGSLILLPAALGACGFRPHCRTVIIEITIPA